MCWYTILGIKDNLERGFRSGCQMGEPWSRPSPRSFSHDMLNGTGAVPLSYSHCIEWQLWGLEIAAVPLVLEYVIKPTCTALMAEMKPWRLIMPLIAETERSQNAVSLLEATHRQRTLTYRRSKNKTLQISRGNYGLYREHY